MQILENYNFFLVFLGLQQILRENFSYILYNIYNTIAQGKEKPETY